MDGNKITDLSNYTQVCNCSKVNNNFANIETMLFNLINVGTVTHKSYLRKNYRNSLQCSKLMQKKLLILCRVSIVKIRKFY